MVRVTIHLGFVVSAFRIMKWIFILQRVVVAASNQPSFTQFNPNTTGYHHSLFSSPRFSPSHPHYISHPSATFCDRYQYPFPKKTTFNIVAQLLLPMYLCWCGARYSRMFKLKCAFTQRKKEIGWLSARDKGYQFYYHLCYKAIHTNKQTKVKLITTTCLFIN